MRWSREPLYQTSGWFNQEPLTTLDETLRFPVALEEIFRLAHEEYGLSVRKEEIKIRNGFIYFRSFSDYLLQIVFQPQLYPKILNLLPKLSHAKEEFNCLVEEFLKELTEIRQRNLNTLNNGELYDYLIETIRFDADWIFRLGGGLHTLLHYFGESVLRILYSLLVKDLKPNNYSELLIGYSNKLLEADKAFWQVIQGKLSQEEFISKYGYRATDATLAKPTIGENIEEFERRIEEFEKLTPPDFDQFSKSAVDRRKRREEFVGRNFRDWVPFGKTLFNKTLNVARKYITVREDRRFYYTMGTHPIRQACLELGSRFDFLTEPSDISFMTRDELETAVRDPKILNGEEIRKRVGSRKTEWQTWREQTPPTIIED